MLRVYGREWETTSGLGVGRIWEGFLEVVVLELSLKGREDWCNRDGAGILRVTRAWEHIRLPWDWRRIWKGTGAHSLGVPEPARGIRLNLVGNEDGVCAPLQEPYHCDCVSLSPTLELSPIFQMT